MDAVKEIPLKHGFVCKVDGFIYPLIKDITIFARYTSEKTNVYVDTYNTVPERPLKNYPLHRYILGLAYNDKRVVDHINGDGLDNRLCNLRACTQAENARNRKPNKKGTSKFKGVSWDKEQKKWLCEINSGGRIRIGRFRNEIEAAKAYNDAAIKYHGKFARLNVISAAEYKHEVLV